MQVIRAILFVTALGLMAGQSWAVEDAAPAKLAITNPPPAGVHAAASPASANAVPDAPPPMTYDVVVPKPPPPPEPPPAPVAAPAAPEVKPAPEVKAVAAPEVTPPSVVRAEPEPKVKPTPKPAAPAASTEAAPSTGEKLVSAHRLSVQDKLLYSIEEDPIKGTQAETIAVNAVGETNFRISRGTDISISLRVLGRSIDDVKEELKRQLDADYYNDAHVRLTLQDSIARSGMVLFIGNGTRGGSLPIIPGEEKRIFEAVYQIGINQWANLKKVKLSRPDPATKKAATREIDLIKIKEGDRTDNVLLQDGDIVEVPEKVVIFN